MKIKLIVFDMAGTTVHDNDFVNVAFKNALEKFGHICTRDEINEIMGMPKPLAIQLILEKKLGGNQEVTASYVNEIHSTFQSMMIDFYSDSKNTLEITGATETFESLRKMGVKVAIDTGFDRKIADAIFNQLGWIEKGLIDFTVTSDEVENGRPHPDMVFKAMEQLGIQDASEVGKVGDTPSDLNEGTNAKCGLVIGVLSGAYRLDQLENYPHTHILDDITSLPELISNL